MTDGHRVIEHYTDESSGLALHRECVYGLNYIDEPVAQYHEGGADPHYVLQDANYSVVGLTDSTGALEQQYSYRPYGERLTIEDGTGAPLNPGHILTLRGHQGLWEDRETGACYTLGRIYDPRHGRWVQGDPNETGLLVSTSLAMNVQTQMAFLSLLPTAQYGDGMSLYQYVGSNPITGQDPSGQMKLMELLATATTMAYVEAMVFAAAHPTAMAVAGGLVAAFNLYAFAQYEEIQAIVVAQPNPLGVLAADAAAIRLAMAEVLGTGGSIRALGQASAETAELAAAASAHVKGQYVTKTGEWHHAISKKIYNALEKHQFLKGLYKYRDARFATQAIDMAAHNGYQKWHRALDDEVVEWIEAKENINATAREFESFLRWRYSRPDLLKRFPDGLPEAVSP